MKFTCPFCGHEKFYLLRESPGISVAGEFSHLPELTNLEYSIVCGECVMEWGYWHSIKEVEAFIRLGDYTKRRL